MILDDLRELPPTLTVGAAGELLGLCRHSAYAAARAGDLPTLRIGRRLLVPTPKLLALLGATYPIPVSMEAAGDGQDA
jgi:hypothetical protein